MTSKVANQTSHCPRASNNLESNTNRSQKLGARLAQQDPNSNFNLLRYFSLASLLVMTLAAVGVGYLSYVRARDALLRSTEAHAIDVAENISYQIQTDPGFGELRGDTLRLDYPDAQKTLSLMLPSRLYGLRLAKAKLFDTSGKVIFSTDPKDICDSDPNDEGFVDAKAHQVFSEYGSSSHDASEQELPPSFLETYVPLLAQTDSTAESTRPVIGVVEIYQGVTVLEAELRQAVLLSAVSVGGSMLLLYLALLLIVLRADRIIRNQTQAHGGKIWVESEPGTAVPLVLLCRKCAA